MPGETLRSSKYSPVIVLPDGSVSHGEVSVNAERVAEFMSTVVKELFLISRDWSELSITLALPIVAAAHAVPDNATIKANDATTLAYENRCLNHLIITIPSESFTHRVYGLAPKQYPSSRAKNPTASSQRMVGKLSSDGAYINC